MKRPALVATFTALLAVAQYETTKPYPGQSRVKLAIRDNEGRPTGVRLRVTNEKGEYFAPLGFLNRPDINRKFAGNLILGDGQESPLTVSAYVYDGAEIDLPFGLYRFEVRKGLEYAPIDQKYEVKSFPNQTIPLPLRKIWDLEAAHWIPGDTHMHFPDPAGIRYEMECEGLRVCSLLLLKSGYKDSIRPGEGHFQNVEHFTGKLHPVSDKRYLLQVGEEFRHGLLAHLIFQGLRSIVWPVSVGDLRENGAGGYDWPLMAHATDEAHGQGAVVTWAHWPYPSLEAPLDMALGKIDSIDLMTTGSPFEHHPILTGIYKMQGPKAFTIPPIDVWYHYLNTGLKIAVSSGSDKMALNPPMGSARTYAYVDGNLTYRGWIDAIRAGRTFATTGPLVEFTVNGALPGATLPFSKEKPELKIRARVMSIEPYEVVELIHNGKVIKTYKPEGEWLETVIEDSLPLEKGGWIALRAVGKKMLQYGETWWKMPVMAHSSPIYLNWPGHEPDATESADLFLDQLSYLRKWAEKANMPTAENRAETMQLIAKAEAFYQSKRARN